MTRLRGAQYAFNGGEISRRMEGRSDLDGIYDRAVAKMLNFVATVEGPAMKRPGFRYIAAAASSASWLSRFVFNLTQSYVLEWGNKSVRFYTNDGLLPGSVGVPYLAAEAPRISIKQSYDRLYLAHSKYPPAMLTRTGATTFTYQKIPLVNGPFKDLNTDKSITVAWSGNGAVGGLAQVTASASIFSAGRVGAAFMFEVEGFENVLAWEPQVKTQINDAASQIAVGVLVRSDGKVYKCVDLGGSQFTGSIQPTHTSGAEWDGSRAVPIGQDDGKSGGVRWEYQYDRFGMGVITSVASGTSAQIKVTRALPTTLATYKWAHGCFSDAEGWPQLVTTWGQRLIFIRGVEVVGSVIGDYFNFAPVDSSGIYAPDMAFRRSLNISDPPVWIHADKEYLLAGSYSEELVIGQINRAAGLSSDNLRADPQSSYGSADVWPCPIGTAVLFVQRGGRKIREADYTYERERFVGANISIYARHITRSGVKWMAFQQEPEEMLWGGRADGVLFAHPHSPEQAIKGFSRVQLGQGAVISGVAIPSTDGQRDDLWILATLGNFKAVLQLGRWWDDDPDLNDDQRLEQLKDAFYVDWGVSYSGPPKSVFTTGLSHLEGQRVAILADGAIVPPAIVTGGKITLPKAASKVHIGLGYQARLKLLRAEQRGGPTVNGMRKALRRVFARLIDTLALKLVEPKGEEVYLLDRPNSLAMDKPKLPFNGATDNKAWGGGSDFEDAPEFVSYEPLPAIISMIVPTYDVEELKP